MANKKTWALSLAAILLAWLLSSKYFDNTAQSSSQQHKDQPTPVQQPDSSARLQSHDAHSSDRIMAEAFANQQNDVAVEGSGIVKAILKDDKQGSRHQKFILQLASGQTVLVAHNIDLAARIEGLRKGDRVDFKGDYEYSAQGGVIHWTHRDPSAKHLDGWLQHQGTRYQ